MGSWPPSTLLKVYNEGILFLELTSQEDSLSLLIQYGAACWLLMFGKCVVLSLLYKFMPRPVLKELRVFRDEQRASRDYYFLSSMALLVLKKFYLVISFLSIT